MRSRKFLICFIFVVVSLLSFTFNVKAGTYETSELIKVEGAQVRTSGNAGLRFVATETYEGTEETYGILLAFGEAEANESFVVDGTVNGKTVANAVIATAENGQFAVTLYDIPEVFYGQKVSARAYVKVGENYVYASTVTVRSLVEVAEVAYEAGNRTPFVENIYKTINGIELNFNGGQFVAPYNFHATKLNGNATGNFITICTKANETAGSNQWWHRVFFKATEVANLWKVAAVAKSGADYPTIDYDYVIGIHQNIGLESETWAKAGEFVNLENATDYYAYFTAPTGEGTGVDVNVKIEIASNSTLLLGGKALFSEGEELPSVKRAGYDFNGWYDNAELTGEVVTTHVDAQQYYASYTPIIYSISYEFGNGWPTTDEWPLTEYTVETETIVLPGVDEMEYDGDGTFGGWYDNALFTGEQITEIPTGSYGDLTLYAKWISNESETIELSAADTAAIEALTPTKIVYSDVASGNYVVNGVTYAANSEAFPTLAAAVAAAVEGDKIYVFAGTYNGAVAITVANVTVYGPNYGVVGKATRNEEAEISGVTAITANNVTLNGLKHTGPISVAGSDITITNCYVAPTSTLNGYNCNRKGCIADTAATTNLTISNCYINAPGSTHTISAQFLTLGAKATNFTLTGNYITNADATATGSYTPAASRLYSTAGTLTISNNEFAWGTSGYLLHIGNNGNECTEINVIENIIDTNSNMTATAGIQITKAAATINYIGNVFKNCSGSTILFGSDAGSTVTVKYNNFAAGTAFKVGDFGSANISFENNYYAESAYSTATKVTPTDFDAYTHDADGLAAYEAAYAAYKTQE